jgi:hypothetical protein
MLCMFCYCTMTVCCVCFVSAVWQYVIVLCYCSMTVCYACKITMRPVSINPRILELSSTIFTKLDTKYVFRSYCKYWIFPDPAVGNKRNALVSYKRSWPHGFWGPEIICLNKICMFFTFMKSLLSQIIKRQDNVFAKSLFTFYLLPVINVKCDVG